MSRRTADITSSRAARFPATCAALLLTTFLSGCVTSPQKGEAARQNATRVKNEFLHAWHGYERYAWGHDALKPLSKTPRDWYGEPPLMSPVDALDTLIILGCRDKADKTRELIATKLSFDRDVYV